MSEKTIDTVIVAVFFAVASAFAILSAWGFLILYDRLFALLGIQ